MSPERCLCLALICFAPLPGCGRESDAPPAQAPVRGSHVASEAAKVAAAQAQPAAAMPAAATAGDVMPPLPKAARLLAGGTTALPLLPSVSCSSLAPDREFKLGPRVEVMRRPEKEGDPSGTLELCLFNRWLKRTNEELPTRTGRVHHFVAAFPGDQVASWTSDELKRAPANARPEWVLPKAAGWSALIPTGLPDRPALAVVSSRSYDGPLGEEIHWHREARILKRSKERWAWVPLAALDFVSLDAPALLSACQREETEGDKACLGADERVEAHRRDSAQRGEVRQARMAARLGRKKRRARGKGSKRTALKAYIGDPDPQAAWLRDGRAALARGRWALAIDYSLRIDMACGEPVREAHALLAVALKKGGGRLEKAVPPSRALALCDPLFDKSGPKRER